MCIVNVCGESYAYIFGEPEGSFGAFYRFIELETLIAVICLLVGCCCDSCCTMAVSARE